jgi:hypothetical protein
MTLHSLTQAAWLPPPPPPLKCILASLCWCFVGQCVGMPGGQCPGLKHYTQAKVHVDFFPRFFSSSPGRSNTRQQTFPCYFTRLEGGCIYIHKMEPIYLPVLIFSPSKCLSYSCNKNNEERTC